MDIVKIPAPILKKKTAPIAQAELKAGTFEKLVQEMHETMITANGIGLAANQINKDLQLFVIEKNLAEENEVPDAFVNPEITEYSKDQDEMEEGCLSIPGYYVPIQRSKKVKIKALDLAGNKLKFKARGFLARVLQHETDHLNGIVIKDRAKQKSR